MTDVTPQDATPVTAFSDELLEGNCYAALTHSHLNVLDIMARVRSPKAGAIVIFAGTTRDNFGGRPVKDLEYTSYKPKALLSMLQICKAVSARHSLTAIAMVHRLGTVPVGEESIVIAVSCPHRGQAWKAGEEALEECKAKVEVWKREEFGGDEGGVWRANRDGAAGVRISGLVETEGSQVPNDDLRDNVDMIRPGPPIGKGHGPVVH